MWIANIQLRERKRLFARQNPKGNANKKTINAKVKLSIKNEFEIQM